MKIEEQEFGKRSADYYKAVNTSETPEEKKMFEKIRAIMLEYVDVPEDSITPDTQFLADLAMTSLDIMTMVGQMEDEFDLTIETEDLNDIFTVQDLMEYLNGKV